MQRAREANKQKDNTRQTRPQKWIILCQITIHSKRHINIVSIENWAARLYQNLKR